MWAAKAVKMGYRWRVGNGHNVKFWSDIWIGSCSLAIVYYDLFTIVNEQDITIAQALVGGELCLTFRSVSPAQYNRWIELVQMISTVSLSEEADVPIWILHSSGTYSVSSFYAVVNDRGWCLFTLQLSGSCMFPHGYIFSCGC